MPGSKFKMMPVDSMTSFLEQPLHDGKDDAGAVMVERQEAMLEASRQIALICADLLDSGLPEPMVAEAMIGATIHFYDAAGLADKLPDILRMKASRIEQFLLNKGERHN